MKLKSLIMSSETGLDAIKRAPIVFEDTGVKCLRIQDISNHNNFCDWGFTKLSNNVEKKHFLKKDDILIARTGASIGVCTYISTNLQSVFNNGLIRLKANPNLVQPKYLFYFFSSQSFADFVKAISGSSATQPNMRIPDLLELNVPLQDAKIQQHIVDIIGSVDDLIEKYEQYSHLLTKIGNLLLMNVTDCECKPIFNFCTFVKGKEIGSKNYSSKGNMPFIRVSNLENHEYDNYTDLAENLESCQEEDILIALDGAPGRVAYGLNGYYSSGIYKIKCQKSCEGLLYFYLTSDECQQIIKSNASGTTILHASKSIKEMNVPTCSEDVVDKLNIIFENLVLISKQVDKLKKIKDALLHKYFD